MWGTRYIRCIYWDTRRFIPTHVGNTATFTTTILAESVHPHACGEHWVIGIGRQLDYGSSPRMWGTLKNTSAIKHRCAVHPHACGEHIKNCTRNGYLIGSSPRMWGTRCLITNDRRHGRFIPTHVGNTSNCYKRNSGRAVHPHACGEHTDI